MRISVALLALPLLAQPAAARGYGHGGGGAVVIHGGGWHGGWNGGYHGGYGWHGGGWGYRGGYGCCWGGWPLVNLGLGITGAAIGALAYPYYAAPPPPPVYYAPPQPPPYPFLYGY